MLEIIESSVVYQSNTRLVELAYEVAKQRNYNKPAVQKNVQKGFRIYKLLQALQYEAYLTLSQRQKIVYCLIEQADINDFPIAPVLGPITPPTIQVGITGHKGDKGDRGEDGGATDFSLIAAGTNSIVDSFAPSEALAARWDYVLYDSTGTKRRCGVVICDWSADGSSVSEDAEYGTSGIGDTSPITLSVDFFGGVIRLVATITNDTWTVKGSRYFMPNNGTGTGPINTSLQNGYIFVGNASNVATAVIPSGDMVISNTGVFSIPAGTIVNADINASAAIAFSKMATLTASKIAVTDGSGVITTSSAATLTELSYLSGATSNIQAQLDSKVGTITGAISTVVSTNLTPSKILVSDISGKIAIGGASSVEAGYLSGVTSSIQTQLDGKVNSVGVILNKKVINIGDWNMQSLSSPVSNPLHGLNVKKIRGVSIIIRDDTDAIYTPLEVWNGTGNDGGYSLTSTRVTLGRRAAGFYQTSAYQNTGYNRGFITITYES